MSSLAVAPYGAWKSPITADMIVAGTIDIDAIEVDGDYLYWTESRPAEGGRMVIVERGPDGVITQRTPDGFNVRTRVHEYGGGAYLAHQRVLYFSNFADQRLYRQQPGGEPEPLTPPGPFRYANAVMDAHRQRLLCVREEQTADDVLNTIVAIDLRGSGRVDVLVSGNDFYAMPQLSPDGHTLAWMTWNHPNMPWDCSEVWCAMIEQDGSLAAPRRVTPCGDYSVFQPAWSPSGHLYTVMDQSGWWTLYRSTDGNNWEALLDEPAGREFGMPMWKLHFSTFDFVSDDEIVAAFCQNGIDYLARLSPGSRQIEVFDLPYTTIQQPKVFGNDTCVFIGAGPTCAPAIVAYDLRAHTHMVLSAPPTALPVDSEYFSVGQAIRYPSIGGQEAHAFFYPPKNPAMQAPLGTLPPLLVICHGGPTAQSKNSLNSRIQYWTSRGFAVLDVNYGGSTGYGRAYRERLDGEWGIVDVEDCIAGAQWLVERGYVDGERLAIRGGSAGGYTTLCALTFHNVFRAGASFYGVGDLATLATDTHKFESRYLDRLIGPYPEKEALYRERSPIYAVERLNCPVIFFQGAEDVIVPPNQAEMMVAALRERSIPVAYLLFPGEQHGFRRAETIRRTLEAELFFYSRVFGFDLVDEIEPILIDNL